jgi:NADH:ubiquinone oxidoreductase subunit 2 (subunit N)
MAGLPPLAGFFGKFFLFFSAFKAGNHSLIFVGLVMNVISAFYYLRLIKCLFFDVPESGSTVYSFFLGLDVLYVSAISLLIGALAGSILVLPFFLNEVLNFCEQLALSVSSF